MQGSGCQSTNLQVSWNRTHVFQGWVAVLLTMSRAHQGTDWQACGGVNQQGTSLRMYDICNHLLHQKLLSTDAADSTDGIWQHPHRRQ